MKKPSKIHCLSQYIDAMIEKHNKGFEIFLSKLTDKELNQIKKKFSDYSITYDFLGYYKFKKQ